MGDIVEQVKSYITGTIEGSVSREEAADWAMVCVKDESADYSFHATLRTTRDRLAGADLQQSPELYLHGKLISAPGLLALIIFDELTQTMESMVATYGAGG